METPTNVLFFEITKILVVLVMLGVSFIYMFVDVIFPPK